MKMRIRAITLLMFILNKGMKGGTEYNKYEFGLKTDMIFIPFVNGLIHFILLKNTCSEAIYEV